MPTLVFLLLMFPATLLGQELIKTPDATWIKSDKIVCYVKDGILQASPASPDGLYEFKEYQVRYQHDDDKWFSVCGRSESGEVLVSFNKKTKEITYEEGL